MPEPQDEMIKVRIDREVMVPKHGNAIVEIWTMGGLAPFPPFVYTDILQQVDEKLKSDYVLEYVSDMLNYGVRPTNQWISLYSRKLEIFNGKSRLVPAGTAVIVKTADGIRCGVRKCEADGFLRFLPVYANDTFRPGQEGPNPGEEIRIYLATEGQQGEFRYYTEQPIHWTSFGDRIEIGKLYASPPIDRGSVSSGERVIVEKQS